MLAGPCLAVPRRTFAELAHFNVAGRKPFDAVLMFKVLVLQTLYNLSDEQVEYQIRDRISFMRFLGLGLEDPVPDATTVWLFREALAKAGLMKTLFERFTRHLDAKGYIARGGQIIDATIVSAPKQRNTHEENEAIKAGQTSFGNSNGCIAWIAFARSRNAALRKVGP
jgi:transposase, IS5 family